VATIALGFFALVTRAGLPQAEDFPMIAVSGIVGISLYNAALNTGELTISAGAASFIVNTVPIFTALLAFFFLHECLNMWGWIGIVISFVGVTLLAVGEERNFHFSAGAAFVVAAAVLQALYFVFQKRLLTRYRPLQLSTYVVWAGTLFLLPFAPSAFATAAHAPLGALLSAVYLGVLPGAVAYVAWNYALARYSAARAAGFLYLVPPIATVIGFIWLKESPSNIGLIGGVIALIGVAVLTLRGKATR
jgi:drug/metabolite transporter (DMT)-like permease